MCSDSCLFFKLFGYHRYLHVLTHSFPTRRSSDLSIRKRTARAMSCGVDERPSGVRRCASANSRAFIGPDSRVTPGATPHTRKRSEEHTSELQSLMRHSYAVFCLKKTHKQNHNHTPAHPHTISRHITRREKK